MAKPPIVPLVNGRVRLRLLEETDLPITLAWRNQDEVRKWFFHSDVITTEQHQAWWNRYKDRDDDFVFMIEETETLHRPVGQVSIYNIDRVSGRGEFGRLMIGDRGAIGLGLARQAITALVQDALASWGLREVYLEVLETNRAALAVYEACGFQETDRRECVVHMTTRANA